MTPDEEKTFLKWQSDCLRAEGAVENLDRDNQRLRAQIKDAVEILSRFLSHPYSYQTAPVELKKVRDGLWHMINHAANED